MSVPLTIVAHGGPRDGYVSHLESTRVQLELTIAARCRHTPVHLYRHRAVYRLRRFEAAGHRVPVTDFTGRYVYIFTGETRDS